MTAEEFARFANALRKRLANGLFTSVDFVEDFVFISPEGHFLITGEESLLALRESLIRSGILVQNAQDNLPNTPEQAIPRP